MRELDPLWAFPGPNGGPGTMLGGMRWVLVFMVAQAPILAIAATTLAWIGPDAELSRELLSLGIMTCTVAVVQGAWAAARLPRITEDPIKFGRTVVIMAIMELPALGALAIFVLAYFQATA